MNIGSYTFQEFKRLAEIFHGYAVPVLLIGGYMVEMAKARIPEGTLFEAVVETRKCLPDAVQLLTLCSAGNNWMKVHNLGRYAVSLFDKHTGEGVRVSVDPAKLDAFPESRGRHLQGGARDHEAPLPRAHAYECHRAVPHVRRSVPQRGRVGLPRLSGGGSLCHGQPGTEGAADAGCAR